MTRSTQVNTQERSIMKRIFQALAMAGLCWLLISTSYASSHSPKVVWTAVFSNISPIEKNISTAYCKSHTPTVIVTTIKQITSKQGINALNGVNIRYLSYKTVKKDNLYFNLVNAVVSGKDKKGKSWSLPMKLYEQTLSPIGVTYTVWSTSQCKGSFLGTPTVMNPSFSKPHFD